MPSITDFYSGQTVFVTGATGFLGKLVVEKLLRTCELNKIYILVRPKFNRTLDQRFNEIFNGACFDKLKTEKPDFLNKVHLLNGDCSQPMLGLSPEALRILKDEVTCVVHSAANVRFDTDLKTAAYTNVRSVRDLMVIVQEIKNIRAFVYVSTAFSHCLQNKIAEEFYEVDVKPEKLLQIIEILDGKTLSIITPHLLGNWPNTYVYTKALAEDVIRNYKQVLPVTIVRPAVVLSTQSDPVRGWIESFQGVVGVILGVSLGVLRTLQLDINIISPVVPADFVVNAILASAWNVEKLKKEAKNDKIPIYNVTPHKSNSITWGWLIEYFRGFTFVYPLSASVWYPYIQTSRYEIVHKIRTFFYHTLFAYLVDSILFLVGKRTLAVEKYRKINKLISLLAFFTTKNFNFDSQNAETLYESLEEKEKKIFNFDMKSIKWEEYFENCIVGGRDYLLKDSLENVPKAKRKMHVLRILHYLFVALVFYFWYRLFVLIFNCVF